MASNCMYDICSMNNSLFKDCCSPIFLLEFDLTETNNAASSAWHIELYIYFTKKETLGLVAPCQYQHLTNKSPTGNANTGTPFQPRDLIVHIATTILHQSNLEHSMACLAFIYCTYQVPYCIPCCNLQSMIMYVQYIFLFTDFLWMVITWLDWCNLIVVQMPTKYKINTIYYANIRPNGHSEIPKSKATYSGAGNT
jgi:hypothetical protein